MTDETHNKTPRQMLRSMAEDILRHYGDRHWDTWTMARAAQQTATLAVRACEEQGITQPEDDDDR